MFRLPISLCATLANGALILLILSLLLPATGLAETTQYVYDEMDRLVLVVYPDGSAIAYDYDANGNRVALRQAQGGGIVIGSFNPSSGPAGTQVTIIGSGFDQTPAQNDVRFGGVPAIVNSVSATTLEVTVPLGAQSGPIVVEAGGSSAASATDFTVLIPEIAGFAPLIVNPGDPVLISGANLNLDPGTTSFSVAGSPLNVVSLSNDEAVVEAPDTSGQILVNTSYGQTTSTETLNVVPSWLDSESVAGVSTLALDATENLSIEQAGGYAVFEFDAVESRWLLFRILSIETTPPGSTVGYTLYSPSGASILSGSVSATGPSTINVPPLAAGQYTMVFDSIFSTALAISALLELGPQLDSSGTSSSHTGTFPGERSTFVFTATAGDDLSLGVTDLSVTVGSGVYVRVYRPDGSQWTSMSCRTSDNPGCSEDLRNVPETGEYAVVVWPWSSTAVVSYTLTLSHYVDGGTLALDTPQTVAMTVPGQMAQFDFTATAGQTVALNIRSISMTPAGRTVYLQVLDSAGSQIAGKTGTTSATLNLLNLNAGTYTVRLEPNRAATGSATVELASGLLGTLPDDGSSQTFGTTVAGQEGRFTFTATAGDDLSLGVTDLSVTVGSSVYVRAYRPDGSQWTSMTCRTSDNPGCSEDLRNVPETGEYTVVVWPASNTAVAGYTLTLSHYVDGGTLALDTPQTVAMTVPGQMAQFDFTATAGQTVALNMSSISTTPAGKSIYLRVYNAGGSQVGFVSGTTSATLNLPSLNVGAYTVRLEPHRAATGSLQVELQGP